jgi:glucose-1-phosphate adenylyltransferase
MSFGGKAQSGGDLLTMVLSGGQGERLYPLTKDRAKPAVPFGGQYRIIDFTLSNCLNSDLRKIVVLTQYKSLSLDRHLRLGWNIYNPELNEYLTVIPPQQRRGSSWYLGTADAIYQNIYTLEQERPRHVLILSGDHVYAMDYRKMIAFHHERGAHLTISCIRMPRETASSFGIVTAESDGRVVEFQEKPPSPKPVPDDPAMSYVSMGIYVFSTEALVQQVSLDARRDTAHDFGRDVIPHMIQSGCNVYAYNFEDENRKARPYWRDIGRLDAYYEANMDLIAVDPEFNLYNDNWPFRTYQDMVPPAKTVFADPYRTGVALDSLVCSGVIISGGRVQRSILSPGVRINSYSLIEDSILMEGVEVSRHARVRRAIIDKGVVIPQGAQIGYDAAVDGKKFTVTPSGITVVAKGQIVEA